VSRPQWPRVNRDDLAEPDVDEPLEDFDETITAAFDQTRRNLESLSASKGSETQWRRDQREMVIQASEQIAELRRVVAKLVQSANRKASKGQLQQLKTDLETERVARLGRMVTWGTAIVTSAIAIFGFIKLVLRG
jgi:hypothetical protein